MTHPTHRVCCLMLCNDKFVKPNISRCQDEYDENNFRKGAPTQSPSKDNSHGELF